MHIVSRFLLCVWGLFLVSFAWIPVSHAENEPLKIEFSSTFATYDEVTHTLSLGNFAAAQISAKNVVQTDAQSLKFEKVAGGPEEIDATLHVWIEKNIQFPFLFFQWEYQYKGKEPVYEFRTAFNIPNLHLLKNGTLSSASNLRALGTAGLTDVDAHSGSYMFLALAEPQTRKGVVAAWITSEVGSGIVQSGFSDDSKNPEVSTAENDAKSVEIHAFEEFGRLQMSAGKCYKGDIFAVGAFNDARLGLEAYANRIAFQYNIQLKHAPVGFCTWYSNEFGGACSAKQVPIFAQSAAEKLVPWGMDFFQIDSHWQSGETKMGENKNFTQPHPCGGYAEGLAPTFQTLNQAGLVGGLWILPFGGSSDDPFFADKTDFFVKSAIDWPPPGEKNERPYKIDEKKGAPYEAFWGGTCMDLTNPKTRAFVAEEVRQISEKWGAKYFKIDGLWTGLAIQILYINDAYKPDDIGKQTFCDSNVTNVQAYRSGLNLVRESAGGDAFLMGCVASQNMRTLGASYGLLDAMRIGPDNNSSWKGIRVGPDRGTSRYFYNGRIWWNDPDPVYVRDSIPLAHARTIASWCAISGQLYAFGDWLPTLSDERVEVIRKTIPNHGRTNVRPIDLFESPLARMWILSQDAEFEGEPNHTEIVPQRDVLAFFNWDDEIEAGNEAEKAEKAENEAEIGGDFAYLGLRSGVKYAVFDFWNDKFLPLAENELRLKVPAADCRILHVREVRTSPVLVSTSRHVASPILEVEHETWNYEKRTLSAVSRVPENSEYELRIYVPEESKLHLKTAQADGAEVLSAEQNGPEVRVRLRVFPSKNAKISERKTISDTKNQINFNPNVSWNVIFE